MPAADTARLIAELTLKDKMSAGIRSAEGSLSRLDKATSRTQKSLGTFGRNIGTIATVGAAAAAGGIVAVVNAARDYESAFAGVRKTVDATEPELQKLSDAFREMSREIPISAAELASLGEAGGALGVATKDLEEFVRVTALLGVTTDLTSDQAATSLGVLTNVLHLTGAELGQFASSLVALGNAGASTESQIIEIAERAGATAELIGLSTEQVLGFSSAVASLGIESEAGGTALQKFFLDSSKAVAEGGEDLETFAKVAGTSTKQFKKAFDQDAGAALQRFLANLGQLTEGEQLAALEDLGFNDARITRTLLGLANNTALVSGQMDVASDAFRENTALTKEAEQRFKTFDSQLQITKNVLTDIGITIGSKLLPKITPLLQRLNEFVSQNQGKIEEFGTKLADGFGKFADAVAKVDWKPFIDGLRITSDIARTAIGLFMSLPADVQKIAIAALAVNKITGGLGTSIIKDLAGLALGGLKTILAGNVTVVGNVTGAAGAGAAAAAGGRGKIAGAAAAIGKVFLIGAAVGVFAELKGILDDQGAANREAINGFRDQTAKFTGGASLADLKASLAGVDQQIATLNSDLSAEGIAFQTNINGVRDAINASRAEIAAAIDREVARLDTLRGAVDRTKDDTVAATNRTATLMAASDAQTRASILSSSVSAASRVTAAIAIAKAANQQAAFAIRDRVSSTGAATAAAIRNKRTSVTVPVTVNTAVTVRNLSSAQNKYKTIYRTQV